MSVGLYSFELNFIRMALIVCPALQYNNNLRVSNIRVSSRTLIYNVCPKSALT